VALSRIPSRVRSLLAGAALAALIGAGAVVLPHVAGATPGQPTIPEVTAKLDKLAHQNDVLDEQYNQASIDVKARQKAADAAQREALKAAADFDRARVLLRQTVTREYEAPSFSTTGALLNSSDGQTYLDMLNMLSLISTHRAEIVQQIAALHARAQAAQKMASKLLEDAQAKAAALDKQRTQLEAETKKFKALLATLTAQQRAALARQKAAEAAAARAAMAKAAAARAQAAASAPQSTGSAPQPAPAPAPAPGSSSRVQQVVDYAIAQVGKSYVFAGTGPDAFDCSGLTMMAYAQVGVSLPHEASAQYNYGTHVSSSDLQPGDLVFLYSPISHVEIMVGPDLAVSAADPALGVRYVHPSQDMQDYAGATRIL
jgi:cell wall-associated NlpC family hydrolase/outer membrane murein-binding lipoprotein Lpp